MAPRTNDAKRWAAAVEQLTSDTEADAVQWKAAPWIGEMRHHIVGEYFMSEVQGAAVGVYEHAVRFMPDERGGEEEWVHDVVVEFVDPRSGHSRFCWPTPNPEKLLSAVRAQVAGAEEFLVRYLVSQADTPA